MAVVEQVDVLASDPLGGEAELRVYLLIEDLQRQFAAYLGTPTRARGYPPVEGSHSLIVEIAPGLAIERLLDLALKSVPTVEPGLLFVERQFGILEVHGPEPSDAERAGEAILAGIAARAEDQLRPRVLYSDTIDQITDQHAVIINRTRQGSMVIPGESLLVVEVTPALFAAVAANEAERAVADNTLVDVQMIGSAGRVYISGDSDGVAVAQAAIVSVLAGIEARAVSQVYETGDSERLEAVARVALEHYDDAAPDQELDLVNLSENATFFVRSAGSDAPSVLRVHRAGYNSPTQIASELVWMDALREGSEVATPPVINAADGSRIVMVDVPEFDEPRACVMFGFCPGGEPTEDEMVPWFERLGAIAARMHAQAREWNPPPWFDRRTWDHTTSVGARPHWGRWEDGIGVGKAERRQLGRLCDRLGEDLAAYGTGPDRFGLVHADMRLANLLEDDGDVYVIDFDDCGYSWFMYDLAASCTFIEDRPDLGELLAAWTRGYAQVRPLTDAEVAILPTLIMLRRLLVVAWIGSHANTDLARSEGGEYALVTCDLADRHLAGRLDWL